MARNMPIMQVTLAPDEDAEVVTLDLDTMMMDEAEECEKLTGWTRQQWLESLFEDRVRAVKFFIYLARKRAGVKDVDWEAINVDMGHTEWKALDDPDAPADAPAALGVSDDEAGVPTGPEADQDSLLDAPV